MPVFNGTTFNFDYKFASLIHSFYKLAKVIFCQPSLFLFNRIFHFIIYMDLVIKITALNFDMLTKIFNMVEIGRLSRPDYV